MSKRRDYDNDLPSKYDYDENGSATEDGGYDRYGYDRDGYDSEGYNDLGYERED
ncbi:hypothetical protein [Bacillus sp. T33-2]|uniref:hypothetical protein n=1 Tax=Bacillus sp. T33-2 TaxID=2054168 RepID=UPI0015E1302C|nr:hypothetical protein [Bacillus sp. T33-2]